MSFAINYHRWILEESGDFFGKRILEVGAGTGNFTQILLNSGVSSVLACEPSRNMFALLEEAFRGNPCVTPTCSTLSEMAKDELKGTFDAVFYVNVLEHIEDDIDELRQAAEYLVPGGKLVIFVPALPGLMSDFDRKIGHFRRYRYQELSAKVAKTGLEIDKLRFFDFVGAIAWLLLMKLCRRTLGGGSVMIFDRWVVPMMKKVERTVKIPFGKNLLLVARKK
jgi:SAM-dependent methyltransferase